ncbi:hypothetical protein BDM02DRAFT_3259485 [Thelephora ganbajun]|uniref:Uncharacterized protein n=1 Tax=Thelephora ganbajun TaxID=370292 RepID=A0ACB6ZMM9_THEGA|nr:hypothetical protein BDM02DRAFT_3259485 [Thelephora ganbajun]
MSEPNTPPQPPSQGTQRIYRYSVDGLSERSKDQQERFAHDIEWKVVGPMPTKTFLEEFLPLSCDPGTDSQEFQFNPNMIDFASVPDLPYREEEMYKDLCDDLNKIANPYDFVFCDTSRRTHGPPVVGIVKPDIGLYRIDDKNEGNIMNLKHKNHSGDDTPPYIAHMGLVYLFIEVKKDPDQDIFTDPPEGLLPSDYSFTVNTWSDDENDRYRISALGQNAHYAYLIQARQFRTRVFSLTISGNTARIMRWDRSGVLVTEAFDYKASPQTLIDFVWRFVRANRTQQGFDTKVQAVDSREDRHSFLTAITSHIQLQLSLDPQTNKKELEGEVNRHFDPRAIARLTIGNRDVWVSRPLWVSHAIVGRCTVGYWGALCDTKDVVFVKDIWRTNVEDVELEGDILKDLEEKGVKHIPSVVCHGDVTTKDGSPQATHIDRFVDESWVKSLHPREGRLRKIVPRIHYRLVMDIAGYPLSTFKRSRELLGATFDAFNAVMDAHDKAHTLHRDVSLPNIILYRPGKEMARVGCLIDWELGCKLSKVTPRDHVLTGTPAFMSFKALNARGHVHGLKDDLESFIYIVLYGALRWLPVKSLFGLKSWLTEFFSAPRPNRVGGGADAKTTNALERKYTSGLSSTQSTQVIEWLNAAMDLHYNGVANPLWDDGKALREMWERFLMRELPSNDRCVNPVPGMVFGESHSLHATYAVATSLQSLYRDNNEPPQLPPSTPTKRLLILDNDDLHPAPDLQNGCTQGSDRKRHKRCQQNVRTRI